MFCSNCGKEINDSAIFCKYCGKNLVEEENNTETSNAKAIPILQNNSTQINTIFNRDVLNNYLYNVKTLEFYKNKLSKKEAI